MSSFERIKSIVVGHFQIADPHAVKETTLLDALDCDDLDRIEICMEVEEACRVDLTDEDMQEFRTVGDLADIVDRKLALSSAAE